MLSAGSEQRLVTVLIAQLDDQEREKAVAYYADGLLAEGEQFTAPGIDLRAPFDALLGFVDRDPTANWSHSSRYLLVNRGTEDAVSIEARLPPFTPSGQRQWRVAYKAPSVPDAAVAVSKRESPSSAGEETTNGS